MNFIAYAGKGANAPERADKLFKIFVAESDGGYTLPDFSASFERGEIVVLPPLFKTSQNLSGSLGVALDKAVLPFRYPVVLKDVNGAAAQAISQAAFFFNADIPNKKDILTALGNLIAGYAAAFKPERQYSPVVETIRADIESSLTDPFYSVEETLKRLPLSYEYLRKLFKKETGVSPLKYLSGKRMLLAAEIISGGLTNQYSDYTVSQIAEECGFSDPMYFSRMFKKTFGVPPTEYGK